MSGHSRRAHTFIVRIWMEPRDVDSATAWRAELQHVPSGRTTRFQGLDLLATKIRELLGESEEHG